MEIREHVSFQERFADQKVSPNSSFHGVDWMRITLRVILFVCGFSFAHNQKKAKLFPSWEARLLRLLVVRQWCVGTVPGKEPLPSSHPLLEKTSSSKGFKWKSVENKFSHSVGIWKSIHKKSNWGILKKSSRDTSGFQFWAINHTFCQKHVNLHL